MANVLVFIDNPGQALKKSSLELLTIARSLGETAVAVNGELSDDAAGTLGAYGAATVFRPSAADLDDYLVAPKAAFLAAVADKSGATTVLLENSPEGKEIAARLGIRLSAGVITDVVAVDADGTAHKSVLAGSYTTTAKATTAVTVLSVKANTVDPEPAAAPGAPETVTVDVPADGNRRGSPHHLPGTEGRQRPPGPHRRTHRGGRRTRPRRRLRPRGGVGGCTGCGRGRLPRGN